jgi:hypothetical protein
MEAGVLGENMDTHYSSETVTKPIRPDRTELFPDLHVYWVPFAPVKPSSLIFALAVTLDTPGMRHRLITGCDKQGEIHCQTADSHTIEVVGKIDYRKGKIKFKRDWPWNGRELLVTYKSDKCVIDRIASLNE